MYRLYKVRGGNYNISYPSEFYKERQKCEHSGSLKYLQEQIKSFMFQINGCINDNLALLLFSAEELQKMQDDIKIMQGAIEYLERKKIELDTI